MSSRGLVIQSQRQPLPHGWLQPCLDSVKSWAAGMGFDYRYLGDELFECLSDEMRERTAERLVVATDLARLHHLKAGLAQGYETVVWCDADFLILRPERLTLPATDYGVGREVWVQQHGKRLRAYVKVHNAFLFFRRGNPFLDFYIHAAERLVLAHAGPMAPQFVGPKLLTALNSMIGLPVVEAAGVLCPMVVRELLQGPGPALTMLAARSACAPAGVNLCSSSVLRGELTDAELAALCARLGEMRQLLDFSV